MEGGGGGSWVLNLQDSRVYEGDHDVSGPLGDGQPLVVVGQPTRVHQQPALQQVCYMEQQQTRQQQQHQTNLVFHVK